MTFAPAPLSIMHANATPMFVDVETDTGNPDDNLVEAAITPRRKAIMPMHLYGQKVDMVYLKKLAQKHNLFLIEDAAHYLEGVRDNIRVDNCQKRLVIAFTPPRALPAVKGRTVSTSQEHLRELLQKLRLHGMSTDALHRYTTLYRHYDVEVEGWKYNMYNLQAALLIDQIDEIESRRQARERLANYYRASFGGCPGIEVPVFIPGVKQVMNNLLCPIGWLTNLWKFMLSSASIDKLATNG